MKTLILAALSALTVTMAGCAASTPGAAETGSSANDVTSGSAATPAAATQLVGTFNVVSEKNATLFNQVTLKADGTFTGQGGCRQDGPGPHCNAISYISGTYTTAVSGPQLGAPNGAPQVTFEDTLGQSTTYFFSFADDGQLTLRIGGLAGDPAGVFAKVATTTAAPADEAASLAGRYSITGPTDDTIFNTVTLTADGTFSGQGGCRQDTPGIHCMAITHVEGTWKTAKSGPELGAPDGAQELVFTDAFGQATTYFYKVTDTGLELRPAVTGDPSIFNKAE